MPGRKPAVSGGSSAVREGAWRMTREEDSQMSSKHSKGMYVPLDKGEDSSSVFHCWGRRGGARTRNTGN